MTQAVHSSTVEEGGKLMAAGDPGGFVVRFPNGFTAYHAGDTAVFKDMELIRELYHPELAMLPIGSHYVMNPAEAALACRLLQTQVGDSHALRHLPGAHRHPGGIEENFSKGSRRSRSSP